jgi:RHS repeat-associated protein
MYPSARANTLACSPARRPPLDAYAYRYDPAGNRTIEQIQSAVTTSAYNILNQMTGRSGGGLLTITGTLDRPGTVNVSGTTYLTTGSNNAFAAIAPVVTGSNNIVISATNVNGYGVTKTLGVNVTGGTAIPSLSYDPDGNLVSDSTLTYGWDAANRLTTINYPSGAHSTFAYDGQGRRVLIIETGSSGGVTSTKNLVWEGMTIAEEKNASGTVTKRYFGQGVQLSGSNYYYARDHLGSIRELTNTNGVIQAEYDYDPYGRQTQLSGTMTADFGFTGLYVHQPSGLDLAPYREYSATLGRWISRDSIGNPYLAAVGKNGTLLQRFRWPGAPAESRVGPNLYRYVADDPVNRTDHLGLFPIPYFDSYFGVHLSFSGLTIYYCEVNGTADSCKMHLLRFANAIANAQAAMDIAAEEGSQEDWDIGCRMLDNAYKNDL